VHETEVCSNCSARFDAREALTSSGVPAAFGVIFYPGVSAQVKCPGCGRRFSARTLRYFGFLSPNAMRWVLLSTVVLAVALVVGSSLR
jgi:hypothetical protein